MKYIIDLVFGILCALYMVADLLFEFAVESVELFVKKWIGR